MISGAKALEKLARQLRPASAAQGAKAAVALLLRPANQDLRVLLVRRTKSLRDPWSGQVALPGGKRDFRDRNLKQTIVREVLEEVDIDLRSDCRFLGVLGNVRSVLKPKLLVTPFVIYMNCEPKIRLGSELERYMWVLLGQLQVGRGTTRFPFGEYPSFQVNGNVVWGLTFRILERFVEALKSGSL
jgi:8-oxo-dGTP pyrophosphatase MutT (NUDIX family)